jgi:hypothetical protein
MTRSIFHLLALAPRGASAAAWRRELSLSNGLGCKPSRFGQCGHPGEPAARLGTRLAALRMSPLWPAFPMHIHRFARGFPLVSRVLQRIRSAHRPSWDAAGLGAGGLQVGQRRRVATRCEGAAGADQRGRRHRAASAPVTRVLVGAVLGGGLVCAPAWALLTQPEASPRLAASDPSTANGGEAVAAPGLVGSAVSGAAAPVGPAAVPPSSPSPTRATIWGGLLAVLWVIVRRSR